jgi:hypothetical protein
VYRHLSGKYINVYEILHQLRLAISMRRGGAIMQKSVLLAAIQNEIHQHDFSTFIEELASKGGKGVVVPGCPMCKKRLNTVSQFLDRLANDAMPALINRLSVSAAPANDPQA